MPFTNDELETLRNTLPTLDVWRQTMALVEGQEKLLARMRAITNRVLGQRDVALARVAELEKLHRDRDALDAVLTRSAADEIKALRSALQEIAGMNVGARHIAAQALAKVFP